MTATNQATPRKVGLRYEVTMLLKDGLLPRDIAEYAGCSVERVKEIEADILRACKRRTNYQGEHR